MEVQLTDVAFTEISTEFAETFGYVRQDLAAIRRADLGLNYTVVLLICCACQMLAWHRNLRDDQVFASLLPDDECYRLLAKKIFEALRNGLAHSFRPHTIKVGGEHWRFSIRWHDGPPIGVILRTKPNDPNWLQLNAKVLEENVAAQIDAYQKELQTNACARVNFLERSRKCTTEIPGGAKGVVAAWNSLMAG